MDTYNEYFSIEEDSDEKEGTRPIKPKDYLVHRGFNRQYKERDLSQTMIK